MLPDEEIDILILAASQAMELAKEGRVAEGYTALLTGFERAQEWRTRGKSGRRGWWSAGAWSATTTPAGMG